MNVLINTIKKEYKGNNDLIIREININKNNKLYLIFFESLCDQKSIYEFIVKNVDNYLVLNKKINNLYDVISSPKLVTIKDKMANYYLENGFCIVIFKDEYYAIEVRSELDRGITTSQTEPNMYGPKDAFCENYQKNLGVLKRRIKSSALKIESIEQGTYTKTKVSLIYINDKVNNSELNKIKKVINKHSDKDITDSYDLCQELKLNSVFPTILKTEKPSLAAKYLLKGYIIIMMDNTPFVLVMDAKFSDFVNPSTTDKFVKILRYICLFLTIMTPAIYISLINFDQETIPIDLLINFSEQRDTVPFPAIIEALLMLFTCEILREADIRFPTSYGSAASILGALILGEAAVNAGLVSAIMIIIISITFITNLIFTEIKLVWAIRIMRISFLLIASILGLYGIGMAFVVILSLISNVKMYEGEYL